MWDGWIFRTDAAQRAELRQVLGVSQEKFESIASKVDETIGELSYFDAWSRHKRPVVIKLLSQISDRSEQLADLLDRVLFPYEDEEEPNGHFAQILIHLYHPAKGDYSQQQITFHRLINDLRYMKLAADKALKNPHLESTTKKVTKTYYVKVVIKLAEMYKKATGEQPGRGEETRFARFVKACYGFAGRPLAHVKDHIYAALGRAKK